MKKPISDVVEALKKLQDNPGKHNLTPVDVEAITVAISEIKDTDSLSDISTKAEILLKLVKFLEIVQRFLDMGQNSS